MSQENPVALEARTDTQLLDWLFAHPLEALDIFGHIKPGEEPWGRQDVRRAMEATHGEQR